MSQAREKQIIDKYKEKFSELLSILDDYTDPRLFDYSSKISKTTDEKLFKQIRSFEARLEDNYQKIFRIMIHDMSLLYKAQTLLKHAYRQRHPSTNPFNDKDFSQTPLSFKKENEITTDLITHNEIELEKEKTRVFELKRLIEKLQQNKNEQGADYQAFKEIDFKKEKTWIFTLEDRARSNVLEEENFLDEDENLEKKKD